MTSALSWLLWMLLLIGTVNISESLRFYTQEFTRKCSYGERGSLTATCVNVNAPSYFKSTPYRFDHLDETLQCLNCSLKSIEPNTFDISGNQIKHLKLRDCAIEDLQQRAFVGLVFLNELDLSSNKIQTIHAGTFAGVKKIVYVNLNNNSLALLPSDGFAELANLETLILSRNKIAVINSKSFSGLNKLKLLDLHNNQISNVTEVFNNITTLQYLDLSENSISTLTGKEFNNLTSLLELKFDKNKIKMLPSFEFSCMTNLLFMGLSNNFIQTVEASAFDGLHTLETLDLGNNQLVKIPERMFQNLHGLVNLNLTGNKLMTFQISRFSGLPNLRVLNLSHNSIEDIITTGIFPIHSLHTLDLSNNNQTDLDYVSLLHRIPRLTYLSLKNNYWPCSLQEDMTNYFLGENFKFILYDTKNGSVICNEDFVRKEKTNLVDPGKKKEETSAQGLNQNMPQSGGNNFSVISVYIYIVVLSCAVIALAYGQYRISRELRFNPLLTRRRTTSEVKLVHSDLREEDNDFMR